MFDLGLPELLIILAILLLFFGSTKLPKLARSLGQSAKELREGMNEPTKSKESKDKDSSND